MKKDLSVKTMQRQFSLFAGIAVASLVVFSGCEFGKKKEKKRSLIVVNVLAQDLYDDCRIPGSIQVDFDKVSEVSRGWPKSAKVVAYCANYACTASAVVARDLRTQGFDAYEYAAGMAGWFQAGLPVEGPAQSPYLRQPNELHTEEMEGVSVVTTDELKQWIDKEEGMGK